MAKILVVEDEEHLAQGLRFNLEAEGHEVEIADDGRRAAELLADPERAFDLVILDLMLPEMNGFELMDRLQGDTPGMDVILMTGNVEDPDQNLVRAIDEGAFYFIQKPFDRRVLLTLVGRCIELRRLRRSELRNAARTDADLRVAVAAVELELRHRILAQSRRLFGEPVASSPGFECAMDISLQLMMGAAMSSTLHADEKDRALCACHHLWAILVAEHDGVQGVHLQHCALELPVHLVKPVDPVKVGVDHQEANLEVGCCGAQLFDGALGGEIQRYGSGLHAMARLDVASELL